MNLTRRLTLLTLILLGVLSLTQVFEVQEARAAWNPAGEATVVTYEVVPAEQRIKVTLTYRIKNLDPDTRYGRGYYAGWNTAVPSEATSIKAYDANRSLFFTTKTKNSWTYLELRTSTNLYYGQSYAFSIEYDMATTQNVAVFRAYGKGNGASTVRVMLPRGYYDEVSFEPTGYTISQTDIHTVYTYVVEQKGRNFSTTVEAFKTSDVQSLSDTVNLKEKLVNITVHFWDGEDDKIRYILDFTKATLLALEDVVGAAFPPAYQVVIKEVTRDEIGGYGGSNAGTDGIRLSYKSMNSENTIAHELAHYWADKPPWKEAWMREGFAELYAYLALVQLGEEGTAETKIVERRTSFYEENKDRFELVLSQWNRARVITEENQRFVSFGYSKSFVFVFSLYSEYGAALLKEANQVVYESEQSVDWFDYLHILEKKTGDELGPTFVDWVLPQSFGSDFDQWQSAEIAYWDTEGIVTEEKGAPGISVVEAELEKGKEFIINGNFAHALVQIKSTTFLFNEWQTTETALREAERIIVERKGSLGISIVEAELEKSKEFIIDGNFTQALSQIQSATLLFSEWQTTEKTLREAEETIAEGEGALGISIVEAELEKSKEFIINGDFAQALSQIQSATLLFSEWQTTEKTLREAERAITQAKSAGRTWRLEDSEQTITQASALLREGALKESMSLSQLAREIADNTTTPLFGIAVLLARYFGGLGSLLLIFIAVRRLRAKTHQG